MIRSFRPATLVAMVIQLGAPFAAWADPPAAPRPLRVMTYNIKHGQTNASCTQPPLPSPDCNLDLKSSIGVMLAHRPDVIGVQEVDRFWARSSYLDEPAELAAALGMPHYCYAANLDHAPDSHSTVPHQYGTVILSRYPILECENTLLPRADDGEQRGLTRASIDVRGVPLRFYNTHLHTTALDRLLQTAAIASVVDAAPGPKVLVGDFNAQPTAVEMQPIYARFLDAWREAALRAAGDRNGYTSPARLASHAAPDPTARIDFVFVSPDVEVFLASVLVDGQTRLASDHYPIVSDIALPRSAVGIRPRQPPLSGCEEQ